MPNKKCIPGVICIENVTLFFLVLFIFILGYLLYISVIKKENNVIVNVKNVKKERDARVELVPDLIPNYPYNNQTPDVLMNPYIPPLADERYFVPYPRRVVPINISTNPGAVDTSYRQMGILTPLHNNSKKEKILPLMGRPLYINRDKWQYYTMSDQNNSVKLPILYNGRSCTNEYGCDRLYTGDTVYVEGLNEPYKVKMYDNDTIRYLPSL
jgi:hypothetical protein